MAQWIEQRSYLEILKVDKAFERKWVERVRALKEPSEALAGSGRGRHELGFWRETPVF